VVKTPFVRFVQVIVDAFQPLILVVATFVVAPSFFPSCLAYVAAIDDHCFFFKAVFNVAVRTLLSFVITAVDALYDIPFFFHVATVDAGGRTITDFVVSVVDHDDGYRKLYASRVIVATDVVAARLGNHAKLSATMAVSSTTETTTG
jgi:hypothetical protein